MVVDIRKVALLMSCLPRRLAASLIERLPEEYGDAVHHCLNELTDVDQVERQRVVREFLGTCQPPSRRRYRVDAGEAQPPSFHFLVLLPPAKIVELLRDEMPQTQAVILSQLSEAVTDEVFTLMSDDRRSQVAQRLRSLSPIPAATMHDVADVYRQILNRR